MLDSGPLGKLAHHSPKPDILDWHESLKRAITSSTMLRAAGLWADVRKRGKPTADMKELDCDAILAAQALEAGAIVATENVGHLERYVTAKDWRKIIVA